MPADFDPQKFLAERQIGTASPESAAGFDPQAFIQARGIQTLPNNGAIEDGATAANSFAKQASDTYQNAAPVVSKGLLPGGQYAAPALESFAGAVDQTINGKNNFGDQSAPDSSLLSRAINAVKNIPGNFKRASNVQLDKIAKAETNHPVASALTELTSSIPAGVLGGAALEGAGLASKIGQTGVLAASYGFANSDKDTLLRKLGDASWAGLAGMVLHKGIDKVSSLLSKTPSAGRLFKNAETGLPEVDPLTPDNVGVTAKPRTNGDFDIKFQGNKDTAKTAYQLSKEEGALLSNKDLQAKVEDQVANIFGTDERPGQVPQLIEKTKQDLGIVRDGLLKDKGSLATDVQGTLEKAWDSHSRIGLGGDLEAKNANKDLPEILKEIEFNLRSKSPTGNLDDVPLRDAFLQKQKLAERLFGPEQLYRRAPGARSLLTSVWDGLGKAVGETDPQVKTLTDGFNTLYKMQDNSINGVSKLEALTNPNAGTARNSYKDFINPMMKLDPNTRASLMPQLQEYVANDMPKILNKKAVIQAVNKSGDSSGGLGWVLNKMYLNKATALQAAGAAGKLSNVSQNAAPSLGAGLQSLSNSPLSAGPTAMTGALSVVK